jgi:hypothetical protein
MIPKLMKLFKQGGLQYLLQIAKHIGAIDIHQHEVGSRF